MTHYASGRDSARHRALLGWMSDRSKEIGDFSIAEADPLSQVFKEVLLTGGESSVPVQFHYSNAVHGPKVPIDAPHNQ